MPEQFRPEEFAGKWVSGEIGNGPDPETSGEYDPSEPRPDQEDISWHISSKNEWRKTNPDQASYNEWYALWKAWSEGTKRPGLGQGMDGWTQEDFQAVFSKLLPPENNNLINHKL